MQTTPQPPLIAIACGGSGGHLFPGLAVAETLRQRGCDIALMVSSKEVDQQAVQSLAGMEVVTLPAVALQSGDPAGFLRGCSSAYRIAARHFARRRPRAVLAMGGFTSAPPILAGKMSRAATFLHEANSIPGRANRWLSPFVDQVFLGFAMAGRRIYNQSVKFTGTPVRPQFKPAEAAACRVALGLDAARPVLLTMGGSQGASGLNDLVRQTLPTLAPELPELQYLHLTGPGARRAEEVKAAYQTHRCRAVVRPFLTEMELALGAATVALSRAGASSLAELAAMQVPSVLLPYPHAADDHQRYNAQALAETGAARHLAQATATPSALARTLAELVRDPEARSVMRGALRRWFFPDAAEQIAESLMRGLTAFEPKTANPAPAWPPAAASDELDPRLGRADQWRVNLPAFKPR